MVKYQQADHCHLVKIDKKHTHYHEGVSHIIINAENGYIEQIDKLELILWRLLHQPRTFADAVKHIDSITGTMHIEWLRDRISSWYANGLLIKVPLKQPRHQLDIFYALDWLLTADIPMYDSDRLFTQIYQLLFGWWKQLNFLMFVLLAGMIALCIGLLSANGFPYYELDLVANIPALIVVTLGSLFLHELGHAMAMKAYGATIVRVGVQMFLGLPVFYVDTSSIWAKSRTARIVTAIAGVAVNAFIASLATLAAINLHLDSAINGIFYLIAIVNLSQLVFSLIPSIKMDGYFLLIDLLGLPYLEEESSAELKSFRLRHQHHWGKVLFGVAHYCTVGSTIAYSVFYWIDLMLAAN